MVWVEDLTDNAVGGFGVLKASVVSNAGEGSHDECGEGNVCVAMHHLEDGVWDVSGVKLVGMATEIHHPVDWPECGIVNDLVEFGVRRRGSRDGTTIVVGGEVLQISCKYTKILAHGP